MKVDLATAEAVGLAHQRRGVGSDDAIDHASACVGESVTAVAVADGHSDQRCIRSRQGARLATQAALSAAMAERLDALELVRSVVVRWRALVDADLARSPLTSQDFGQLNQSQRIGLRQDIDANPRLAYGTTLLVCRLSDDGIDLAQIGDGDIVAVTSEGRAFRPLAKDLTTLSATTSSLSQNDANAAARTTTLSATGCPAMLILATDGIDNAYPDDDAMLRAGAQLFEHTVTLGRVAVRQELTEWASTAASVSGDDATAALIWIDR